MIFGGNRLKYAVGAINQTLLAQAARVDAGNDKDAVAYDIISQFYNLYKVLQKQKGGRPKTWPLLTARSTTGTARFFDQGIVTKNDVLRFQLQRANIELNGIDLETNRKIVNYNLCILLVLPDNTKLNIDVINEADSDRSIWHQTIS